NVIYSKDTYGFIHSNGIDYFYHQSDAPCPLAVGDTVEFSISNRPQNEGLCATELKLIDRKKGNERNSGREVLRGVIVNHKDKYGFIYCEQRSQNIFYHISELQGDVIPRPGTVVDFSIVKNPKTGKENAVEVRLVTQEEANIFRARSKGNMSFDNVESPRDTSTHSSLSPPMSIASEDDREYIPLSNLSPGLLSESPKNFGVIGSFGSLEARLGTSNDET